MKRQLILPLLLSLPFLAISQDKPSYQIFDAKGKESSYKELLKAAGKADVVFFGEEHDNPIAHWLELELLKDLFAEKGKDLIVGAEMFERDDQIVLDEYLAGLIKEKNFKDEAKLWSNYQTDYKPLVEFARENGLPFIGTNIPRRYASLISSKGLEGLDELSAESRRYIAPQPIEVDLSLPGYKSMMEMMEGHGGGVTENFPKAQAAKDATMAWSISEHWKKGKSFLHFNGSYHSNNQEGILWYLDKYAPKAKTLTIGLFSQEKIDEVAEDNQGVADFIIVVPESMTRTY
ncbi:MAG: ChaN family lipoprotein [Lewinellaceae bacterium]|nr:ChaN family lipoprotein [Lewinellaceae bacterium]